jgi:hypothetical protein
MAKYARGANAQNIPNYLRGYVLRDFGFAEKVHVSEGKRYNIERGKVLTLLNEGLKP